jgi:DNA repair ATPase RecN
MTQMRLSLSNFRSYDSATWQFDQPLTLIQGKSGAGKSTIFQAIYWLLYGGYKVRNTAPHSGKSHTWVELELDDLVIRRDTKPNRLTLSDGQRLLEGAEAQQVIDKRFGPADYWLATSYIQQGQRCALLTASDRLSILNRLSFSDDDPDELISRIEERLATETRLLQQYEDDYRQEASQAEEAHPTNPEATPATVTQLEEERRLLTETVAQLQLQHDKNLAKAQLRDELQRQLDQLEAEIVPIDPQLPAQIERLHQAYQQHLAYTRDRPRVEEINRQLAQLPSEYPGDLDRALVEWDIRLQGEEICQRWGVPYQQEAIDAHLERLRQRDAYRKYRQAVTRAGEIDQLLSSLPEGTIEEKELWQIEQDYAIYRDSAAKCAKWNIPYDQASLADRLATLDQLIERAKRVEEDRRKLAEATRLDSEITQLESKLAKLPLTPIPDDKTPLLEERTRQLDIAKRAAQLLPCPHCQGSVRYHEGKLFPDTVRPVDPKVAKALTQEVEALRQQVAQRSSILWERQTIEAKRAPLIKRLEELRYARAAYGQIGDVPQFDLPRLTREREELSQVVVGQVDLELARGRAERLRLQRERDALDLTPVAEVDLTTAEQAYRQLSHVRVIDVPDPRPAQQRRLLEAELAQLTTTDITGWESLPQLRQRLSQQERAQQLIPQRDSLRATIDGLAFDPVDQQLSAAKEQLATVTARHRLDRYSVEMAEYRAYLSAKERELASYRQAVTALANLKSIAQRVQHELLESVVATINSRMEEALGILFEEPISVSLSLYRELKNKKVKPQVNLLISYRGGSYDNIGQLSGGEGDRVSLALAIALNYISGSPFLLLDETLASLDGTYREACTKCLRILDDRKVLVISHEDVEGNYDSCLTI